MVQEKDNLFILEKLYNVRHLGGLKTSLGALTRDHKYIRGSARGKLNEQEKEFFYALGVRVIVDLRSSSEITKTLSVLRDYKDITYVHVDMIGEFWQMFGSEFKDISDLYLFLLDHSQAQIKEVFSAFVKYKDEGIFFHCTAGKDRTGIIAMLLLDLVGVADEDIISNYSVSYQNNLAFGVIDLPKEYLHFELSNPEYMVRALKHLRDNYQNSENYLKLIGLTAEEIEILKRSLIA